LTVERIIDFDEYCHFFSAQGPIIHSKSVGKVNPENSAKWVNENSVGPLTVRADYWILEVDPDYQWIVTGQPNRSNFWILARKPSIDPELYKQITARAKENGFNVEKIEFSDQSCA
jgi:lipocalin